MEDKNFSYTKKVMRYFLHVSFFLPKSECHSLEDKSTKMTVIARQEISDVTNKNPMDIVLSWFRNTCASIEQRKLKPK